MDPTCILMCANIPRGIPEEVLIELFCVAGPLEDVSIGKSGRSCFIIYEYPEAVTTAKEIFKDVKMYGYSLQMFDENDIKQIHINQEQERSELQLKEAAYAEVGKQYNPFYNADSMTPTSRNSLRGRPRSYPQNQFDPSQNYYMGPPVHFTTPNHFTPPPNHFPPPPNHFTSPPNHFTPPPNHFNGPQNKTYGDNYDPSATTHRWGSTAEINPSQSPNTTESDPFKSPYSQPVSRRSYEQSKRNYDDDASNYNYSRNRSFDNSKRNSDKFSSSDVPKEPPVHNKKFKHDNQGKEEVHLFKDTIAEYAYEEQTRRQFYDSSRKSHRENDRHNNDSRYDAASSSSGHSNRYKSRDYEHSSQPRNVYQQRSEQRESRKPYNYHGKESRNHRR